MKSKILSILVAGAFSPFFALPEGVSATALKYEFDKDHVKSWAEEGKKAGAFVRDSFSLAEKSVMATLLEIGGVVAGTPSQEDFLTGYAAAWSNSDTAKSRKTDARAVFNALSRKESDDPQAKPFMFERIVGWEPNPDQTSAQKQLAVKDTKSAHDWMTSYEGDFKGFLALAREINNAGTGRASQGTTVNRRNKVTDKQFDGIMEALPVANAKQAMAVISEANSTIGKMPNHEPILVTEMEMLCNRLKTSKNPMFVEAAAGILDILAELREQIAKNDKLAAEAKANTTDAKGDFHASTPAPAQQQKKAA